MKKANNLFHVIIVDKSLKDISVLSRFGILSQTIDEDWIIYEIAVKENILEESVKYIQSDMHDGNWYFHAYNKDGSKLIIIFKSKIFRTDNNPKNWEKAIEYGVSRGTPKEQLDFIPNTFNSETY